MVKTAVVGGRTVGYRREPGTEPTLVCIHGSADNHHAYDRLFRALAGVARIAIDSPGRLSSEGPPLSSVAEHATFVSRFVEAFVQGDYVAIGHSVGGAIAIEHALATSSARLKGLVLLASGARLRVHPAILRLFEQLTESGTPAGPTPGLFQDDADPALFEEATRILNETPPATGLADWRAADGFDRMTDVANIRVPTLIIAGATDRLTPPKYGEYLNAQIPTSQLVILEGAGHMFPMERAPEVAQAIRTFMKGTVPFS